MSPLFTSAAGICVIAWMVIITLRVLKIERQRRRERLVSRLFEVISEEGF